MLKHQFSKKVLYTSVKVNTRDPIDPDNACYTKPLRALLSILVKHPELVCNIMHAELFIFEENPELITLLRNQSPGIEYFLNTGKPSLEDDSSDFDLDDYFAYIEKPYVTSCF
jgi:hypothetical protein